MNRTFALGVSAVVCTISIASVAAPQPRPGEPTQGRVWIQNREAHERIPVSVREVGSDVVLRAQVTSLPAVHIASDASLATRRAVQQWEYLSVFVPSGADPAAALRNAGFTGWETTGLQFAANGGAQVLLKKPRP
jgi:hypothetical protein